jgi:hypothetical protein
MGAFTHKTYLFIPPHDYFGRFHRVAVVVTSQILMDPRLRVSLVVVSLEAVIVDWSVTERARVPLRLHRLFLKAIMTLTGIMVRVKRS